MSRISRNVSIILRTERLIAQRNLTVIVKRTGFFAAAGLAAGLAVIMLNVAGYLALSEMMSKPLAALVVAMVNVLVAIILAALANSFSAQADTAPVAELRDIAISDIESEVQDALAEARRTAKDLQQMSRDPLGAIAPGLVGVIVNALLKHLKSAKK
ncbi:MAG: phage holin family protein [Ruegeria sp.]